VGRGRVALQSVNRAGLSRAQRHPILRDVLERDEKLFATLHRHGMQFVAASELALECEFAHELFLIAARPPHSDVRFRGHAPWPFCVARSGAKCGRPGGKDSLYGSLNSPACSCVSSRCQPHRKRESQHHSFRFVALRQPSDASASAANCRRAREAHWPERTQEGCHPKDEADSICEYPAMCCRYERCRICAWVHTKWVHPNGRAELPSFLYKFLYTASDLPVAQ
jgi:hypothetical protein